MIKLLPNLTNIFQNVQASVNFCHLSYLQKCFLTQAISLYFLSVPTDHPVIANRVDFLNCPICLHFIYASKFILKLYDLLWTPYFKTIFQNIPPNSIVSILFGSKKAFCRAAVVLTSPNSTK